MSEILPRFDYLLPKPEEKQRELSLQKLTELFARVSKAADQASDPSLRTELKVIAALGTDNLKTLRSS